MLKRTSLRGKSWRPNDFLFLVFFSKKEAGELIFQSHLINKKFFIPNYLRPHTNFVGEMET
jgi:hypothetical protein